MSWHDFSLKFTPPHDAPYLCMYLFIVKMEMYVYQTLQTIEINHIRAWYRDMNIQTLGFVQSDTRFNIRLNIFFGTPFLIWFLTILFSNFINIPPFLAFLTTPSTLLAVALGFLFFSNISSLASILDCEALISSISLGNTLNMSDTSFFCCKFDFLYNITASDLWPVCSLINCGSTPFLNSLVQVDFLIEWFLKFPSTPPPLHHILNVTPQGIFTHRPVGVPVVSTRLPMRISLNIEPGPMVRSPRTQEKIFPEQFNQTSRPNPWTKTIRNPCWIFAPIRYPPLSCFRLELPVYQSILPINLNNIYLTIRVPPQFILFLQSPQSKPNTYQKKHCLS